MGALVASPPTEEIVEQRALLGGSSADVRGLAALRRPDDLTAVLRRARREAAASGTPVEIEELGSSTSRAVAHPDGKLFAQLYGGPQWVEDERGRRLRVDPELVREDGAVRPMVAAAELWLSPGGTDRLVSLAPLDSDHSVALTLPDGVPTSPSLDGPVATYPDVLSGIDARVTVGSHGFRKEFVVKERPSEPLSIRVHVETEGLRLERSDAGGLRFVDGAGATVATVDPPSMWGAGEVPMSSQVDYDLSGGDGEYVLTLRPAESFLNDPALTYPVSVDPSTWIAAAADSWILTDHPYANPNHEQLLVGQLSSGEVFRTLMRFEAESLFATKVISADLYLYNTAPNCVARTMYVRDLQGPYDEATTVWANAPSTGPIVGTGNLAYGDGSTCPTHYDHLDVTQSAQSWVDGGHNFGIEIRGAEDGTTGIHYFASSDWSPTYQPWVHVQFDDGQLAQAEWLVTDTLDGQRELPSFRFGDMDLDDDFLTGDFDGDGRETFASRRGDQWLLNVDGLDSSAETRFVYGSSSAVPVVGDWDGNGTDTVGVRSGNTWQLRNENTSGPAHTTVSYGSSSHVPLVGDWDGDGADGIGVKVGDAYHLDDDLDGQADHVFSFGLSSDTALVGDWDGDGVDTIGVWRSPNSFELRNDNSSGPADVTVAYGSAGDVPLTGDWNGDGISTIGVVRELDMSGRPRPARLLAPEEDDGVLQDGLQLEARNEDDQAQDVRFRVFDEELREVVSTTEPTAAGATASWVPGQLPTGRYWWTAETVGSYVDEMRQLLVVSEAHDRMLAGLGLNGHAGWASGVNATLSNLVHVEDDLDIPGAGPTLGWTRTYNSRDPGTGWMGAGWSTQWELTVTERFDGSVVVRHPDGRREIHQPDGSGGFDGPPGYHSTLTELGGGGWSLVGKDGAVRSFGGDGQLVSVADAHGRTVRLEWNATGDVLEIIDDTSGRSLVATFNAGGRVQRVEALPAPASGPIVWTYQHVGDWLLRACDPHPSYGQLVEGEPSQSKCTEYTQDAATGLLGNVTTPEERDELTVTYENSVDADGNDDIHVATRTDGAGGTTTFDIDRATRTVTVTNPRGNDPGEPLNATFATVVIHDEEFRETKRTDPKGNVTVFGYDADGNRDYIKDAAGHEVEMGFDDRGNLLSRTNPAGGTVWHGYDGEDNRIWTADERSADASDQTYRTTFGHADPSTGAMTSETTPGTHDFPAGVTRTWTYTDGTEPAVGGGTTPPGLLAVETDFGGDGTHHYYDAEGDRRKTVDPAGKITEWDHDALGRVISEQVTTDSFPNGMITLYEPDEMGRVRVETRPVVHDADGNPDHQLQIVKLFDGDGLNRFELHEDLVGETKDRLWVRAYDGAKRETGVQDPLDGVVTREFDAAGNVVLTVDQEGREIRTDYDTRNLPTTRTALATHRLPGEPTGDVVVTQWTYDDIGRIQTETDAEGRATTFEHDHADRLVRTVRQGWTDADGTTHDVEVAFTDYDPAGNVELERSADGRVVRDHHVDPAGRRWATDLLDVGAQGVTRTTTFVRDEDGDALSTTVTQDGDAETRTATYDPVGRRTSRTVQIDGGADLTTFWTLDDAGNVRAVTDPDGNTADHTIDEAGRTIIETLPQVDVLDTEDAIDGPHRPTVVTDYDAFGNPTTVDDRGAKRVTVYDKLDRERGVFSSPYITPEGTKIVPLETFTYDKVGNLVSETSRRGHTTTYTYDSRNRLVEQDDPDGLDGPDGDPWQYFYDEVGNRIREIDPTGATTRFTHDALDRVRTTTEVVRPTDDSNDPPQELTTTTVHEPSGLLVAAQTPLGHTTTHTIDGAGNRIATVDPTGETWTRGFDLADRPAGSTDPLGRQTAIDHDAAGRKVSETRHAPDGTELTHESWGHDAAGNVTSHTTPEGHTTTFDVDALGQVTEVTTPVDAAGGDTITTQYRHDLRGNLAQVIDGDDHLTRYVNNRWDQTVNVLVPPTVAHPDTADRLWTTVYDAGGLPVEQRQPGGTTITRTFDPLGRLDTETGTSDDPTIADATADFTWDPVGRRIAVSHPDGTQSFTYDDRGLLAATSGPAGDADYVYDHDGRLASRTDAAGTATFGWTDRDELDDATDPATGATLDWTHDTAGQVDTMTMPGATRDFGFDDLGRLTDDVTVADADGSTLVSRNYDHDDDGKLTQATIDHAPVPTLDGPLTGIGGLDELATVDNPADGTHTFGYDDAGRLDSWDRTTADGMTEVDYGWDGRGNRTTVDTTRTPAGLLPLPTVTETWTYDARSRIANTPDGPHTHNARGDLILAAGVAHTFDALGRQTSAGTSTWTHDGLGRIATASTDGGTTSVPFTYNDTGWDPVVDTGGTYTRSPAGRVLAIDPHLPADPAAALGLDDITAGLDAELDALFEPRLAGIDRHGDLGWGYDPDTAQLTSSRVYDPFGPVAGQVGTVQPTLGFQSDHTDPTTGQVWQGTRWYQPTNAVFTARDTVRGELRTPISLNRHLYAFGDPLGYVDPDGRYGIDAALTHTSREVFDEHYADSAQYQLGYQGDLNPMRASGGFARRQAYWERYLGAEAAINSLIATYRRGDIRDDDGFQQALRSLTALKDDFGRREADCHRCDELDRRNGLRGGVQGLVVDPWSWMIKIFGQGALHVTPQELDEMASYEIPEIIDPDANPHTYGSSRTLIPLLTDIALTGGAASVVGQTDNAARTGTSLSRAGNVNAPRATRTSKALEPGGWAQAPDDGFLFGWRTTETLKPGTVIDRYGLETGRFFSPAGTPLDARSLPPGASPLQTYEVVKPLPVDAGVVAPAWGQPGYGVQYMTELNVADLIRAGVLKPAG